MLAITVPTLTHAGESDSVMNKVAPILVNLYRSVTITATANSAADRDSSLVDPEFYRDFVQFDIRNGEYWLPLQVSVDKGSVQDAQDAVQRLTDSSVHTYGSVIYGEFPLSKLPDLNALGSVLKISGIESGGTLGSSVFLSSSAGNDSPSNQPDLDVKKKAR